MRDHDWIREAAGRYERPLLAYVRGLLGDPHRCRDVVQEAFLELCRADRAAVEPKLAPWLFTVCRRRAVDALRKDRRMSAMTLSPGADPPTLERGPAEVLEVRDATRAVFARLASLPASQQEAVRLRFLQQFSYRDIAGVMGLSESHVGVLLHLALKTLRESFADPAPESQS